MELALLRTCLVLVRLLVVTSLRLGLLLVLLRLLIPLVLPLLAILLLGLRRRSIALLMLRTLLTRRVALHILLRLCSSVPLLLVTGRIATLRRLLRLPLRRLPLSSLRLRALALGVLRRLGRTLVLSLRLELSLRRPR